jgi:DNA repair protein RadC
LEKIYEVIKIKQVVKEIILKDPIHVPCDLVRMVHQLIGDDEREVFLVICLNTKNYIIAVHRCHIGSLDSTIISPREVFKACILNNARSLIVAHNHPSTNLNPSDEDFEITKLLRF